MKNKQIELGSKVYPNNCPKCKEKGTLAINPKGKEQEKLKFSVLCLNCHFEYPEVEIPYNEWIKEHNKTQTKILLG